MQGQILDSKEYYAPIITPYEAQLAFSAGAKWTGEYSLEFDSVLESAARPGVSPGLPTSKVIKDEDIFVQISDIRCVFFGP